MGFPDDRVEGRVWLRIVCKPASKGSKNAWGREMFPKQIAAWERATVEALWLFKSNCNLNGRKPPQMPLKGDVRVTVSYYHERPKKHYTSKGTLRDDAPLFYGNAPDIDKITRCALDALTKARVIDDDRYVAALIASKLYCGQGELPGALMLVERIE